MPLPGRILVRLAGSVGALGLLTTALAAQAPAPILQISIEQVKVGRGGQHGANEARWAHTFRNAKVPVYWLGTSSITGANEAWFFTPLQKVADIEAQEKAIDDAPGLAGTMGLLAEADAENLEGSRSLLARYRPDLSRPASFPVAQARYFMLIVWRLRPGTEGQFAETAKLYASVINEADPSAHWAIYQIESGMAGPTYLGIVAMKSLAEMDPSAEMMKAMEKAMTPARLKQFNDLASGTISATNMVVAFRPGMSHLPADMIAQDPDFWTPKP